MSAAEIETTLVGRPDLERASSPRSGIGRRRAGATALHVGLVVAGIAMVFPFAWMLITSFKTLPQLLQDPRSFWPSPAPCSRPRWRATRSRASASAAAG